MEKISFEKRNLSSDIIQNDFGKSIGLFCSWYMSLNNSQRDIILDTALSINRSSRFARVPLQRKKDKLPSSGGDATNNLRKGKRNNKKKGNPKGKTLSLYASYPLYHSYKEALKIIMKIAKLNKCSIKQLKEQLRSNGADLSALSDREKEIAQQFLVREQLWLKQKIELPEYKKNNPSTSEMMTVEKPTLVAISQDSTSLSAALPTSTPTSSSASTGNTGKMTKIQKRRRPKRNKTTRT